MDKEEDKDNIQDILDSYRFTEEQDLANYKLKLAEISPVTDKMLLAERILGGLCIHCGKDWESLHHDKTPLVCDYCRNTLNLLHFSTIKYYRRILPGKHV